MNPEMHEEAEHSDVVRCGETGWVARGEERNHEQWNHVRLRRAQSDEHHRSFGDECREAEERRAQREASEDRLSRSRR